MSIAEIIELVGLVVAGAGLIFSIIKWVKAIKEGKIKSIVEKYIVEAETHNDWSGKEKKLFVVKSVFLEIKSLTEKDTDKIASYVEECIDFSKKVNFKGKE